MSTPLDTAVLLGKETTYGTPAALTHAFEAQSDPWKRQQAYINSRGFRAGAHGTHVNRRKTVLMGAEGAIEVDLLDRGMGFLFEGLLGSTTGPTDTGDLVAFTSTHASDKDPSGISYTVQVQRPVIGGSVQPFTYHGAVPTGWSISHDVEGLAVLSVDFDSEDEDISTAAGAPSYVDDALPFDWTEALVTVGGTPIDPTSFEFTSDLGMKTDRRFIRNSALKKQPRRINLPTFEGTLSREFEDTAAYSAFVAGDNMPLVATWEGGVISGSTETYKVVLTVPAIQYTEADETANLDDVSTEELPFTCLWNGTDPVVTVELTSDDTAF